MGALRENTVDTGVLRENTVDTGALRETAFDPGERSIFSRLQGR